MAQDSGFFNAEYQDGEYDRVYNAEQFAAYFAAFIGNGIFGGKLEELLPLANDPNNMSVNILSGRAWMNGWWYENDETLNMPIEIADGILSRKDIIVVRWGVAERNVLLQVVKGEPSYQPQAPEIRRDADYFDLKLCEIDIPAGTSKITQSQITDTRLDNTVCGLVTGVVDQIDTTNLYLQFRSQFGDFMNLSETQFTTWYTGMQNAFTTWMNAEKADYYSWKGEQETDFEAWYEATKNIISETTAYNIFGMITEDVEILDEVTKPYSPNDLVIYKEELREVTANVSTGDELDNSNSQKIALSTLINRIYTSFSNALTSLKNTAIAQAVGATGSTFTSVIAKLAEIVDRGAVSQTLDTSTTSYTVPKGYHNGSGAVVIDAQTKSVTPTGSEQNITPDSGKVLSKVVVNAVSTQTKSVTPSTSAQTVSPDSGKLLSSVTVNAITPNLSNDTRYQREANNSTPTLIGDAGFFTTVYDRVSKTNLGKYFEIRFNGSKNKSNVNMTAGWMNSNTLLALPSQTKTVTPSTSKQTISPDSNKVLESVTVNAISTQTKTITASRSQQNVTPDSGKYLTKVTVNKYPDANGTYKVTGNGTHDMGTTNNYRYVEVNVSKSVRVTVAPKGHLAGVANTTATVDWWGTADVNVYVNGNLQHSFTVTSGSKRDDARKVSNSDTPTDAGWSDNTY